MARASIKKATVNKAAVDGRRAMKAAATIDGFQNFILNLGIGTDNAMSGGTYGFNPVTRIRTLLEWIYRGSWMGGIAVDIIADDMTRAGIDINVQLKPEEQDRLRNAEVSLNFWGSINDTIKWARLYGGCIMVMLIDGQDLATPFRDEIPLVKGQLKGFYVLDRWQVEPRLEQLVGEFGPDIGQPMYYQVNSDAPALRGKRIHYSRVLRMEGVSLPYWQRVQENLWGISIFERLYDRMVALDSSTQGAAQLVYKSWFRTYSMKGLTALLGTGGQNGQATVERKMQAMRRSQGQEGITLIDAEDTIEVQSSNGYTGISDVILQMAQQISGTLQIPLVRMFGQSPAGLNSSGESDLRTYYDGIKQQQEAKLRRPVDRMYRVMAQSEAVELPKDFNWTFTSLWQLDEGQKSEISARDATSIAEMKDAGLISDAVAMRELRQNSRTTGRFDNITDEDIAAADQQPQDPLDMGSMGLSDEEIAGAGGDPTKVRHENPNNALSQLKSKMPGITKPTPVSVGDASRLATARKNYQTQSDLLTKMHAEKRALTTNIRSRTKEEINAAYDRFDKVQADFDAARNELDAAERASRDSAPRLHSSLPAYVVSGVEVRVENVRGSVRSGEGWSVVMPADYGYISTVDSAEGDTEWMDAYVGEDHESESVWIFDMVDPRTGKFDEHKCMLGFATLEAATDCIRASYNDDAMQRVGGKSPLTVDEFRAWLQSGDHRRPFHKLRAVS